MKNVSISEKMAYSGCLEIMKAFKHPNCVLESQRGQVSVTLDVPIKVCQDKVLQQSVTSDNVVSRLHIGNVDLALGQSIQLLSGSNLARKVAAGIEPYTRKLTITECDLCSCPQCRYRGLDWDSAFLLNSLCNALAEPPCNCCQMINSRTRNTKLCQYALLGTSSKP